MVKAIEKLAVVNTTAMEHFFKHFSSFGNEHQAQCLEFLLCGSPKMHAMLLILYDKIIVHGGRGQYIDTVSC